MPAASSNAGIDVRHIVAHGGDFRKGRCSDDRFAFGLILFTLATSTLPALFLLLPTMDDLWTPTEENTPRFSTEGTNDGRATVVEVMLLRLFGIEEGASPNGPVTPRTATRGLAVICDRGDLGVLTEATTDRRFTPREARVSSGPGSVASAWARLARRDCFSLSVVGVGGAAEARALERCCCPDDRLAVGLASSTLTPPPPAALMSAVSAPVWKIEGGR